MHYNNAMRGSCSIISLFRALGLFLYQNPPVAQPLFSIVHTDRKPGTGYRDSITQDDVYQVMTKVKEIKQQN